MGCGSSKNIEVSSNIKFNNGEVVCKEGLFYFKVKRNNDKLPPDVYKNFQNHMNFHIEKIQDQNLEKLQYQNLASFISRQSSINKSKGKVPKSRFSSDSVNICVSPPFNRTYEDDGDDTERAGNIKNWYKPKKFLSNLNVTPCNLTDQIIETENEEDDDEQEDLVKKDVNFQSLFDQFKQNQNLIVEKIRPQKLLKDSGRHTDSKKSDLLLTRDQTFIVQNTLNVEQPQYKNKSKSNVNVQTNLFAERVCFDKNSEDNIIDWKTSQNILDQIKSIHNLVFTEGSNMEDSDRDLPMVQQVIEVIPSMKGTSHHSSCDSFSLSEEDSDRTKNNENKESINAASYFQKHEDDSYFKYY